MAEVKVELTEQDGLHCPTCGSPVIAGPIRMYYLDGDPDARHFQCAGAEGVTPCSWSIIWANGAAPMTDTLLGMYARMGVI